MKEEEIKHPSLYTAFVNNHLRDADKNSLSTISDHHFYHEIINLNHRDNPTQLTYTIKDEHICTGDPSNLQRNKELLAQRLQSASFYFDRKFMLKYFKEDSDSSMVPFPEINIADGTFTVRLYARFKWVLIMIQKELIGKKDEELEESLKLAIKEIPVLPPPTNFTKGDIEALRKLKYAISGPFYWWIRKNQAWKKVVKISPDNFRSELNVPDNYKRWIDLRDRVIEAGKEDFDNTWTEFSYDYFPKEKGKKVKEIIFTFRKGPEDENDLPAGQNDWEKSLLRAGFHPHYVKEIRQKINAQSVSPNGFQWSVDYVQLSIEAARKEYLKKQKNKQPVKNLASWLYNGLNIGQWITQVSAERNKLLKKIQPELSFDPHEVVNVDTPEGAKAAVGELFSKNEETVSDDEYIAAYARKMRQLNKK